MKMKSRYLGYGQIPSDEREKSTAGIAADWMAGKAADQQGWVTQAA
jgi:hypothetical protein